MFTNKFNRPVLRIGAEAGTLVLFLFSLTLSRLSPTVSELTEVMAVISLHTSLDAQVKLKVS